MFFNAMKTEKYKPNVIFDVTLKSPNTLEEVRGWGDMGGYKPEDTHIVWVCTSYKIATGQNAGRARVVSSNIMMKTHTGVSTSMRDIINNSEAYRKYADGDFWVVFGGKPELPSRMEDGKFRFLEGYTALHLKERGKPCKKFEEIDKTFIEKIRNAVPDKSKGDWG